MIVHRFSANGKKIYKKVDVHEKLNKQKHCSTGTKYRRRKAKQTIHRIFFFILNILRCKSWYTQTGPSNQPYFSPYNNPYIIVMYYSSFQVLEYQEYFILAFIPHITILRLKWFGQFSRRLVFSHTLGQNRENEAIYQERKMFLYRILQPHSNTALCTHWTHLSFNYKKAPHFLAYIDG